MRFVSIITSLYCRLCCETACQTGNSENNEEAVAREVYEEAGIIVDQIEYMASQPWPFPSSLMLGFRAKAVTTEINFDKDEMEDVRWFTKSEVQAIKWPSLKPIDPQRNESIASYLIARWIEDYRRSAK
ncbi:MAG: NUDIX domain-containing protein [Chloroflexi bacterium]|nr:NUDIX domain-containing protein [Chloroflexota bacterium]